MLNSRSESGPSLVHYNTLRPCLTSLRLPVVGLHLIQHPTPPGKQFNRIYGILSVLLIFFGQLDGFLKLGFSSTGALWSGLSILHHFVIIRRGLLAKQQVMLPCSKSCWIATDRQEEKRGKQVGRAYRWWDRWSTEVSVWPLKSLWNSSWGVRCSVIIHQLKNWRGRRVSHIQATEASPRLERKRLCRSTWKRVFWVWVWAAL